MRSSTAPSASQKGLKPVSLLKRQKSSLDEDDQKAGATKKAAEDPDDVDKDKEGCSDEEEERSKHDGRYM